ncbi:alpha/beta hydrolase [Mycolicibacterium brumae]|uniref:alpha/beta hydrolase n=1 Tax=Mycolicibacterium brumae TaxID=85968 RepID=UPI000AA26331|nr:alpha/beta hydrolase [Mycolicibacterium brumae]RWA18389.1 hypothetical protein MBRU_04020 [Mycolicibacterium brumae DSM 44177]UWW10389.1 alpha/beta hydrolase [Mycolicibacterium brumae]
MTFKSRSLTISGTLFLPEGVEGKLPAIVIGHPVTSVKEQSPTFYAKALSGIGYAVLIFDATYQGHSEGEPRLLEDPFARAEDVKDAVSFLSADSRIDADRIGALGICGSGGYVPFAAQTDRRIKAVAGISAVNIGDMVREGTDLSGGDRDALDAQLNAANAARTAEAKGEPAAVTAMLPMTAEEAAQTPDRSMLSDAYEFYRVEFCSPDAPNKVAVRSFDQIAQFDAWQFLTLISPRPLLLIAGTVADSRAHSERAIEKAAEPKELFWVEGASHVDLYGHKPEFLDPIIAKLTDFYGKCL